MNWGGVNKGLGWRSWDKTPKAIPYPPGEAEGPHGQLGERSFWGGSRDFMWSPYPSESLEEIQKYSVALVRFELRLVYGFAYDFGVPNAVSPHTGDHWTRDAGLLAAVREAQEGPHVEEQLRDDKIPT